MKTNRQLPLIAIFVAMLIVVVTGCSSVTVTKIPPAGDGNIEGIHYYLPKPYIVATPQADGTVNFDVIYLPDKSHEYAVQPNSWLSAYTFQISRDEKGLLNTVEYKADTSLVGQQALNSAGAAATQVFNAQSAQLAADQTQINAAQAALDTANSNVKAAAAALSADTQYQSTNTTLIANDQNALAQAQAKLPIAQAALQRAQQSSQAVATTATAATPGTQAGPTISTYVGQPTWNPPYSVSLPGRFGPVLYSIDDSVDCNKNETVKLHAVQNSIDGTAALQAGDHELQTGVAPDAQRIYETSAVRPLLSPTTQTISADKNFVVYKFSAPIDASASTTADVRTDTMPPTPVPATNVSIAVIDATTLIISFSQKLAPGDYAANIGFSYHVISGSKVDSNLNTKLTPISEIVRFTVQKSAVPTLLPADQSVDAKSSSVSFSFNQPIAAISDVKIATDDNNPVVQATTYSLAAGNTVLNVAVKSLPAPKYTASVGFSYNLPDGTIGQARQTVKFETK